MKKYIYVLLVLALLIPTNAQAQSYPYIFDDCLVSWDWGVCYPDKIDADTYIFETDCQNQWDNFNTGLEVYYFLGDKSWHYYKTKNFAVVNLSEIQDVGMFLVIHNVDHYDVIQFNLPGNHYFPLVMYVMS